VIKKIDITTVLLRTIDNFIFPNKGLVYRINRLKQHSEIVFQCFQKSFIIHAINEKIHFKAIGRYFKIEQFIPEIGSKNNSVNIFVYLFYNYDSAQISSVNFHIGFIDIILRSVRKIWIVIFRNGSRCELSVFRLINTTTCPYQRETN